MTDSQWDLMLVGLLKPFAALIVFGLILLPFRIAAQRWLPEGKLKRFLLFEIKKSRRRHPEQTTTLRK